VSAIAALAWAIMKVLSALDFRLESLQNSNDDS
jgi:hypothetical protein